jgi:oligoribonuclease NrnB/cAMP/cGMP phosphodiesterase (DHH superfamily)
MSINKSQEAVAIDPKADIVVFYHKNCTDGFVAGFVWWVAHMNDPRVIQYIPLQYKEEIGDLTGKEVVMLDVTVTPKQFQEIKRVASSVLVLDHHESAIKDYTQAYTEGKYGFNKCYCGKLPQEISFHFSHENKKPSSVNFSKGEYSGAMLAYNYISEKTLLFNARKLNIFALEFICERISDRDLWEFKYPDSKAVYEVVNKCNGDFETLLEYLEDNVNLKLANEIALAQERVNFRNELVLGYASKAEIIDFMGYKIPAVNCPANMASETGDTLNATSDIPFAFMYTLNSEKVFCSLRSSKNNSNAVNVFEVAKQFSGGGHKHAAGFVTDPETLLQILRSKK